LIDWISKIDIIKPSVYAGNPSNPTQINASIPGSLVLECALPTESIKSEDDFFAGDAQEIEIVLFYNSTLITDALFFALTETTGLNGRFTDELNGDIVKIYNRDNVCIFDGVLRVDGKGFNTEDFTIKFKVFNLMRLFKERAGLVAKDADGSANLVSYLKLNDTEFLFYIWSLYKEFKAVNPYTAAGGWTTSPMSVVNTAPKMGIDRWYNSDVNQHDLLSEFTIGVDPAEFKVYIATVALTGAMYYVYRFDDNWSVVKFKIYHPWKIQPSNLIGGVTDSLQSCIAAISQDIGGYTPVESNLFTYSGVTYTTQFVAAFPKRVRLKGYSGSWNASNLSILPTATNGQIIKLFLLLCGWKMSIKKNVITVTQNYYENTNSVSAITPTISQIKDFTTNTILPYPQLDSDIFNILNESDTAKNAIKLGVELNYNRYLPRITKESELIIHSSAGTPIVGCFIITPEISGIPIRPIQPLKERTYFVYEVTQDQDDTDWYNCKAYNIN
jgi:hypothetical protein